ncbi:Importin-5 [Hondaea fermentalgiana]|uniref:Importin-5 n=1 Tax=Hondaea fermentalgiana TaxID=2315210 RepID=A0A2R5G152_9STRA|nr:Importin-5 [Hondaea fermentalgiana]|eukprot:GBG24722.1 Importin-5 [Hondaea fermentalgiana]
MEGLLRSLQSNNNAERDAAEKQFVQALASDVRSTMNNLLQLVLVSPDAAICQFGAVLFRGQLTRKKTGEKWWKTLSNDEKENLRSVLLGRLQSAPTPKTKRQVSQIVAQVARMSFDQNGNDHWPTLLGNLAQMCSSSDEGGATAHVAVITIEELMKTVPAKVEVGTTPFELRDLLTKLMTSPPNDSIQVRIAAVSAGACLLTFLDEDDASEFHAIVPAALNVVTAVGNNEELLLKWCESVIEMIQNQPRLVHKSNVAEPLVKTMLELGAAAANNGSEDVQKQSLEVCVQIAMELPLAIKANQELIKSLLESCIRLTLSVDEDEDEDDFAKVEGAATEDTLYDHGFRALYLLIENIGEDLTVPLLFPMIHQLLAASGDWRRERAGISALNSLAYTSGKLLYENLQSVLERLVPFVNNPNTKMRVRHVALDTLSTLLFVYSDASTLYDEDEDSDETGFDSSGNNERPNVQSLFGPMLLECITKTLEPPQSKSPAQWAFASKGALAVAYFCSGSEDGKGAELLSNFTQPILERLIGLIKASSALQQQQTAQHGFALVDGAVDVADVTGSCVQAVGAVAKALGEDFTPFYDTFMPLVKELYSHQEQAVAESKQHMANHGAGKVSTERSTWNEKQSHLLGLIMECLSLMGMAVGASKFMPDAGALMEFVLRYMDSEWAKGDTDRNAQVASLATNICVCMGDSVDEAVLGKIMPRFIEWANKSHYHEVDEAELEKLQEEDEDEDEDPDHSKQYVMTEEGVLCINTFLFKDRLRVTELIHTLVADLGLKLMPWAGDIAKLFIELLNGGVTSPDFQLYAVYGIGCLVTAVGKWLNQQGTEVNAARREFSQTLFQKSLESCVNNLVDGFLEAANEDEQRQEEQAMGKEMDEDEDQSSLLLTATANQITEILRAGFESGGLTETNIDRMCNDSYSRERYMPIFNVPQDQLENTIATLVSLMRSSCDRPRGKPWWKDSHNHEVMDSLAESVGLLVKAHGEAALEPFAKHVLPIADRLLDAPLSKDPASGVTPSLKAVGLFFLDDVIEHGGPRAAELVNKAMPHLLRHADAANNGLRQASLFGLGVCVQHGGTYVDPYMEQIVQALVKAIEAQGARTGFGASATDNAISALLKCIIFKNATSITAKFLTYPPCTSDALESRIVHYRLYRALATQNATFMPHADRIRQILIEACSNDTGLSTKTGAFDEETAIVSNETRAWVHTNLGGPAPGQAPVPPS